MFTPSSLTDLQLSLLVSLQPVKVLEKTLAATFSSPLHTRFPVPLRTFDIVAQVSPVCPCHHSSMHQNPQVQVCDVHLHFSSNIQLLHDHTYRVQLMEYEWSSVHINSYIHTEARTRIFLGFEEAYFMVIYSKQRHCGPLPNVLPHLGIGSMVTLVTL